VNNRLRVLRAERGWTQQDLADLVEVTRQTIHSIEAGKYDPSLPLAFRLARLFGSTVEEVFTPDDA
jgi:putative transcriptional regulator